MASQSIGAGILILIPVPIDTGGTRFVQGGGEVVGEGLIKGA
jgi:hypothetical protein